MQDRHSTRATDTTASLQAKTTRPATGYWLLAAIAGFIVARLPVLPHRFYDVDELEHTHAAWSVFRGLVPYRDFFEHHTPWYYYALSPFFRWFHVDSSFDSARHFLTFGRGLSVVLTVISAVLVFLMGRLRENRQVGLLAGFFLVSQPVIFQKTVEMRPDVLALPFFLGSLACLLYGLDRYGRSAPKHLRWFLGSGVCLGGAIMCTQKMLFVLPGLCSGLGLWLLVGRGSVGGNRGVLPRLVCSLVCAAGVAIPVLFTCGAFAVGHGASQFIGNNFLLNSKWTHVSHEQLLKVLETSGPVLVLALLGATVSLYRLIRTERRDFGGLLLFATLAGLVVGIPIMPGAHRQYYLMPLSIVCLFAAEALWFLVELAKRRKGALLVGATLLLSILPIVAFHEAYASPNDDQLNKLRYVFENTKPTDVVMDGIQGMGVFRPHAIYHYFLHAELLEMLTEDQVNGYVSALRTGKVRPRLIALDENLTALGLRFLGFVKENYETRDGFFYLAKPVTAR